MSELSYKLDSLGVTITSVHRGFMTEDPFNPSLPGKENTWLNDSWMVTLTYQGKSMTTQYYTGVAHRKLAYGVFRKGKGYDKLNGGVYVANEIEAVNRGYLKLTEPNKADVVSCLLFDMEAAHNSHHDWCDNFGYDEDSRKALDLYLRSQVSASKLTHFFGGELVSDLCQLTH